MKIEEASDYVQMRDGSAYVGEVTQRAFRVEVGFAAKPLAIATSTILHIVFSNKYGYGNDEINLKDGSSVQGKVVDDEIKFQSETLGQLAIPTKRVLAIQLLGNL
jgi:hypothetical protein